MGATTRPTPTAKKFKNRLFYSSPPTHAGNAIRSLTAVSDEVCAGSLAWLPWLAWSQYGVGPKHILVGLASPVLGANHHR